MTDTVNMLQLFRLLPKMLDEIEDSIYVMQVDGSTFRYYYINRAASELSGITMDAVGLTFFETNRSQMADFLHKNYSRVLSERTTIKYEDGFVLPNGMVSGESILTPIFEENGQIEFILCITRNTTERKNYEDLLRHYAYHDDLTRLFNRRYLMECVLDPSAIFLLDLDYFKNINDTFGHDAGDTVLIEVASRLSDKFGSDHTLVRLGGDEFIIIPTGETAPPERVAESINEIFLAPYSVNEQLMKMSVSIGVARRENNEDIQTLLKQADIALYKAKGEGRKRYHVYEALSKYDHVENFIHELALSNAIALGELELHYQPIYQPSMKKIIGVEALLRWNRSDSDVLSPSEFIPVAEQTGLIRPIGYWVIRKACQDWHNFKDMYGFEFKVSVNISRVQLTEDGFVDHMLRILASENVSPHVIELEITETMVIDNIEEIQRILMRLRREGFTISLDDFGTGYSSLSMLTLLPIDKLKIDKSFIQNMNPSLVSAILVMAKALNLHVIAEGVEEVSQYTMLKEMNCWGLQGFFISKPIGMSEFVKIRKITL